MANLVYLYYCDGGASCGSGIPWNPKAITENYFVKQWETEGFYLLFQELLARKTVDNVIMVVTNAQQCGTRILGQGILGVTAPSLDAIGRFIRPGDIIFVRGGFKNWMPYLEELEKSHWILFYRANTNANRWPMWDIILDDLRDTRGEEFGHLALPFSKPTNQAIFTPRRAPRHKDLCIGASHVHDKKGQWRGILAVREYKKLYGVDLSCILPGSIRRGLETFRMMRHIESGMNVALPGMLPRTSMADIYGDCRVYMHCAFGGQNDRSPMEALACGTPVIISHPSIHAPFLRKTFGPVTVLEAPGDPVKTAEQIHSVLEKGSQGDDPSDFFMAHCDVKTVVAPQMEKILTVLKGIGKSEASRKIIGDLV